MEYTRLLPTIGNSFGMMLDEDLTLADRLKKQLGPPSIRLLVPNIDKKSTALQEALKIPPRRSEKVMAPKIMRSPPHHDPISLLGNDGW